jgi:hypothetical protein
MEANEGIEIFSDKIESPRSDAGDWSIGLSVSAVESLVRRETPRLAVLPMGVVAIRVAVV